MDLTNKINDSFNTARKGLLLLSSTALLYTGCSSRSISANGQLELKCYQLGSEKSQYCNFLETENPNKVVYISGLDENARVIYQELKKENLTVDFVNGRPSLNYMGEAIDLTGAKPKFRNGCVDFGSLGEMCNVLLMESEKQKNLFIVPIEAFNGRIARFEVYDRKNVRVRSNLNDPSIVKLEDLRPMLAEQEAAEEAQEEFARSQRKTALDAQRLRLLQPNPNYIAPVDAGQLPDSGFDAGQSLDAGAIDSGTNVIDAGSSFDGGSNQDASFIDAGQSLDSGSTDSGFNSLENTGSVYDGAHWKTNLDAGSADAGNYINIMGISSSHEDNACHDPIRKLGALYSLPNNK